jgi:hypothetical protein
MAPSQPMPPNGRYPPPVRRETVMPTLNLDDSHARLGWVMTNIDQALPIVAAINAVAAERRYVYETKVRGRFTHVRFLPEREIEIPADLGFVVSDIAVNLRSCLDMAIQALVDGYSLAVRNPQFPIEDNSLLHRGSATRTLLAQVPDAFRDFLIEAQPQYDTPLGHFDIPVNVTALMIREVANANKHRNLTPVAMTRDVHGFAHPEHGSFELVTGTGSAWDDGIVPVAETRSPTRDFDEGNLHELRVGNHRELKIQRSNFRYQALPVDIDIPLAKFLTNGPGYVRYVLKALGQIHRGLENGTSVIRRDHSIEF